MRKALTLAASALVLVAVPTAEATTYNNDAPIAVVDGGVSPYPSTITVTGTASPMTDVNVGIDGFAHQATEDVNMVLEAPTGHALALMSGVGGFGTATANPAFITFDDSAPGKLPNAGGLSTGVFQPTSYRNVNFYFPVTSFGNSYAHPGPGGGFSFTLGQAYNGLSPIGTWKLWITDSGVGAGGAIPGGWSLDINPDVTPPAGATPAPITQPPTTPVAPVTKCKKKKGKKKAKKGASASACKKKGKKKKRK